MAGSLIERFARWASGRPDVLGACVVGSHARGEARPDSDIDLVLVVEDREAYLDDAAWVVAFGSPVSITREDWGKVQSLRVYFGPPDPHEVEFGITDRRWTEVAPDAGTAEVVRSGIRILWDPHGLLRALQEAAGAA